MSVASVDREIGPVFVVSDDAAVRSAVTRTAQLAALQALPMRGGMPALEWARVLRPTVVIVDVHSGRTGGGLLPAIALHPDTWSVTLVAIVRTHLEDDEVAGLGCHGSILSSLEPDELLQALVAARNAATGKPPLAAA